MWRRRSELDFMPWIPLVRLTTHHRRAYSGCTTILHGKTIRFVGIESCQGFLGGAKWNSQRSTVGVLVAWFHWFRLV